MNINEMKESKYMKKEDVGQGALVTIDRMDHQDVSMENQPEEMKWIMYFKEQVNGHHKGLVLNWTNIQLCAVATGSEDTDQWPGKQIVLFDDPNVSFGGKLTGGIRVRKPKGQSVNSPADQDAGPDFDDEIPF